MTTTIKSGIPLPATIKPLDSSLNDKLGSIHRSFSIKKPEFYRTNPTYYPPINIHLSIRHGTITSHKSSVVG
jgi:hypothetical protein